MNEAQYECEHEQMGTTEKASGDFRKWKILLGRYKDCKENLGRYLVI